MNQRPTFALAVVILAFSALGVTAQDTASAAGPDPTAPVAEGTPPLTALESWEADRTQIFDATDLTLDEFVWLARPLVIFADSPNDPLFRRQMAFLAEEPDELAERDVIVITDTNPREPSEIRRELRPRGFMMALIDKDGRVALRKPSPWHIRELTRSIDKTPLRRQEIEERRRAE